MKLSNHHFLLICCPSQGHINPTLHLAHRLIRAGARATFATTVHGLRNIKSLPSLPGLSYASYSDGFDDGTKPIDDPDHIMSQLELVGSQTLTDLILTLSENQNPVTFLIYTLLLPWAATVARDLGVPSAFLCIQSATAFAIYHHYFNKQDGITMYEKFYKSSPPSSLNLPGLPPFSPGDLPSFLLPNSPHHAVLPSFLQHIQALEEDPNPCVLLNTVDSLEEEAIRAIGFANPITVGPLISSAFSEEDQEEPFRCDLFEKSDDCLEWLDSKAEESVVYVSFGTMVVLKRGQIREILHGLLDSGWPFLWVIRFNNAEEEEDYVKSAIKESGGRGLIVPWCSQVKVLSHKSVGCFVMHCGWNSTMESLAAGVAIVGCPVFSDQNTNAKMVEEVWGNGLRLKVNEDVIVEREEIKRCVDEVMGERGEDIKRNALKWRRVMKETAKDESSWHSRLQDFLDRLA